MVLNRSRNAQVELSKPVFVEAAYRALVVSVDANDCQLARIARRGGDESNHIGRPGDGKRETRSWPVNNLAPAAIAPEGLDSADASIGVRDKNRASIWRPGEIGRTDTA